MRRIRACLALTCLALAATAAPAHASRIFALTETSPPRILAFDASSPETIVSDVAVSGLAADEEAHAIDVRPTDGRLYLLAATDAGAARAMQVNPDTGATSNAVTLAVALSAPGATGVGMDFNPVPDLAGAPSLRIITGTDQNMRVRVATGEAFVDSPITVSAGTISIIGSAYTNFDLDPATGTTLFGFDDDGDELVNATNANAGTYVPVAPLGIAPSSTSVGFDISGLGNVAYASALVTGINRFYAVALTGGSTLLGSIGDGLTAIKDIAVRDNLISFTTATATVGEAGGGMSFTIRRARPIAGTTVRWSATGGTATEGSDYTGATGTVTFAPGEGTKTVTLPVVADDADESDETVVFGLADESASGQFRGHVVNPGTTAVTITDDDAAPLPSPPPPDPPLPGPCGAAQTGTAGEDALFGGAGGDVLEGLGAADALAGGAGDDCLLGGSGDDFLLGGDGADQLRGGKGNDLGSGGNGDDSVLGESGNDALLGGEGTDRVDGGAGNDSIAGGAGNDTLTAGSGRNKLRGDAGDDRIAARNKAVDTVDCGAGKRDSATVDRRDRVKGCEKVKRARK